MKDEKLYLLGEAAIVLGVKPYQITYAITTRQAAEPQRIGGRRMFSRSDLRTLAKALGVTCEFTQGRRKDA